MSPTERSTLAARPHTLIDLRWMIPGYTGGSEVVARSLLKTLLQMETEQEFTVLLPAVTRYDFNTTGHKNFHLRVCDGPRYYLHKLGLVIWQRITGQQSHSSGEVWVQRRRTPVTSAVSPAGIIPPDLYPFKNLLFMYDLQHEYFPEFFPAQELANLKHYYSISIEHADQIVTISDFTRQTIIDRMKVLPEKVTTAYLGVDPIFQEPAQQPELVLQKYNLEPKKYCYFPGNTWPHKNHRAALQALQQLKEKHQLQPLLVCTGTPKEEHGELVRLGEQLGVAEQFRFLGYCPRQDLPALYQQAMVLVFPSLFEGFGMPVAEAMSCGCPVICSNTTSLPEVGGEAAFYIDPLNPEMLCEAIYQVWTDSGLRQELIKRGREQARKFSWVTFTGEFLQALDRLEGRKDHKRYIFTDLPAMPNRQERAQSLIHRAQDHWRHAGRRSAVGTFFQATLLAPEVVFTTVVFPAFRDQVLRKIFKLFPV